ncbi:MAG TPA: peptide ABC transporter substrate-binding protein [Candidatus Saccharimonadales bacterium]
MAMRLRLIRLRLRRRLHLGQRQVEDLSQQAEQNIDKHLFRRFDRLYKVRRFVIGWLCLMVILVVGVSIQTYLLSGYFQKLEPVPGGIYNEGVVGTFTTANPLYATNDVDSTVSHLVFASLLDYNSQNQLVGQLASSYRVDSKGTTYTIVLKPHLTWQDGQPLTANDVAFTYHLIENPDTQSPLISAWQGITVTATSPTTVTFKLTTPLASFPSDLTNGIVPEHLLQNVPANELRSANFNTVDPVGAGPFKWQTIAVSGNDPTNAEEQISLVPFSAYVDGSPKLQDFVVHAYASSDQLTKDFTAGQLTGAEGLNVVTPKVKAVPSLIVHNLILTAGVYSFFKTSAGVLADQNVRTALVEAADTDKIISNLGYKTTAVNEPLLEGQLGYNPAYKQPSYSPASTKALLAQNGWAVGANGIRSKAGQKLSFTLTVDNNPEYLKDAAQLQAYWRKVGANVTIQTLADSDFSSALQNHDYDAILYGISIGNDPDVFVYWDSSQADIRSASRLNLSEFKSTIADESLEEGRTRLDSQLRVLKYQPFLKVWQQQLPALGLYQPRLLYLTNGQVYGLDSTTVNTNSDRFANVQNWEINEAKVTYK